MDEAKEKLKHLRKQDPVAAEKFLRATRRRNAKARRRQKKQEDAKTSVISNISSEPEVEDVEYIIPTVDDQLKNLRQDLGLNAPGRTTEETTRAKSADLSSTDSEGEDEDVIESEAANNVLLREFADILGKHQLLAERAVKRSAEDQADDNDDLLARLAAGEVLDLDPEEKELLRQRIDEEVAAGKFDTGGPDGNVILSKKRLRELTRPAVSELKLSCMRPDVVDVWDATAPDPWTLVWLKSYRNGVKVPVHWNQKRKYLSGKRAIEKAPFRLPEYIEQTKIGEIRAAILERESQKTLKQKQRDKSRPKSNRMHVDFQTLHDAFFKYATIPELSKFGDLHYEGKEREEKTRQFKPGQLSMKLKEALSIVLATTPPPWLITMQRYGPPSSYPNLKIPGLNAPLPSGAQWGFHGGGWGKPPSDQFGNPLYPEVFSDPIATAKMPSAEELATIQYWGDTIDTMQDDSDQEELEDEDGETIIPFTALSEINTDENNAGEIPAPPRGPPPPGVASPHYAPPGGPGIKPPLSAIPPLPTAPITATPLLVPAIPNIVAAPYLPVAMPHFGGLVTPTTLIAAHSPGYGLASSLSTPSLEFSPQSIKQQLKEQEAAAWRASEATQENEDRKRKEKELSAAAKKKKTFKF